MVSVPLACSYWWFAVTFEFICLVALIVVAVIKALPRQKTSWMGIFAIASLLYISMTDAFLAAESSSTFQDGNQLTMPRGE